MLYYGRDVQKMVEWERVQEARESGQEEEQMRPLKQASRKDKYSICVDAGLCEFHRFNSIQYNKQKLNKIVH